MSAGGNQHFNSNASLRPALLQLMFITSIFFFNFISRLILAPFLMDIEREFQASHAQMGGLFLFLSLGVCISLASSGFVAQKIKHRKTIILSSLGIAFCLILISRAESLLWLKGTLFLLGCAVGLYLPSGISTITSLLPPQNWGKGLAIHELAPNFSFILAPAIAAAVEGVISWRTTVALLGAAALTTGLLYSIFGRGGNFRGESPRPQVLKDILKNPQFWILATLFGLSVSATFGTYSMLPLYLVSEHGLSESWANQLLSLSRVPCLFIALTAGVIVDRIGAKRTLLITLSFTAILTILLGLLKGIPLQAAVLIQAVFAVCFFPAGFTAISLIFPVKIRNVAVSFIIPVSSLFGYGIAPTILGYFGDLGVFYLGYILLGIIIFAGVYLVALLSFEEKAIEKSN